MAEIKIRIKDATAITETLATHIEGLAHDTKKDVYLMIGRTAATVYLGSLSRSSDPVKYDKNKILADYHQAKIWEWCRLLGNRAIQLALKGKIYEGAQILNRALSFLQTRGDSTFYLEWYQERFEELTGYYIE